MLLSEIDNDWDALVYGVNLVIILGAALIVFLLFKAVKFLLKDFKSKKSTKNK